MGAKTMTVAEIRSEAQQIVRFAQECAHDKPGPLGPKESAELKSQIVDLALRARDG